jgi:hypothetical protein
MRNGVMNCGEGVENHHGVRDGGHGGVEEF